MVGARNVRGMGAADGTIPCVGGTGSRAPCVYEAKAALAGDGSPKWRGPTGRGDGKSSSVGGRSQKSALADGHPQWPELMGWGRGVLPCP